MKRDQRDPIELGEKLLEEADATRKRTKKSVKNMPLSSVWDDHVCKYILALYTDAPTAIEKYGRPDDIVPVYARIRIR